MKPDQPPGPPDPAPIQFSPAPAVQPRATLLCLSHLRWDFVWQRPQQLMSRLATDYEVWFFEEPLFDERSEPHLEVREVAGGITVLVPWLPQDLGEQRIISLQRQLLDGWLAQHHQAPLLLWYFTPMGLRFTRHLAGQVVVFDCMDELAALRHAPPALAELERQLLERADVVFTGGLSLWESRRERHDNVQLMPGSVDIAHFAHARLVQAEPADQADIGRPRLGFFGVLDEQLDLVLLRELAMRRPLWQIILIGPVARIDPASLPRQPNLHYLGPRDYQTLPAYLSGWDVALMPLAINESTRYISPTQPLEYLAGGRPVVSTPIHDVVECYADSGVVSIAATPQAFIEAIGLALDLTRQPARLQALADRALQGMSWDSTCDRIKEQIASLR